MYEAIHDVEENHIVTHENDREWRNAVVMNKPSLLALRLDSRGRDEGGNGRREGEKVRKSKRKRDQGREC